MAFDSTVIVMKRQYSQGIRTLAVSETARLLRRFNVELRTVPMREYNEHTSSKEINKYIRVPKRDLASQTKDAFELIKVGTGRYQAFEQFSSVRYAFMSVSRLNDEYSVLWHSFHPKISRVYPEFRNFPFSVANSMSYRSPIEVMVLHATTFSRSGDVFQLYYRGRTRNSLQGKGALTEVRNMYGIDINTVMDAVDTNLAVYYAPADFAEIKTLMSEQKRRFESFRKQAESVIIEDRETGDNMMQRFEKENRVIMEDLERRMESVERAMKSDPVGDVVFFTMKDLGSMNPLLSDSEVRFGRDVPPPS